MENSSLVKRVAKGLFKLSVIGMMSYGLYNILKNPDKENGKIIYSIGGLGLLAYGVYKGIKNKEIRYESSKDPFSEPPV